MTKLEDLPQKGPFTAIAVANDPQGTFCKPACPTHYLDTKPKFIGSTVIISPIVEFSMEYPYGEDAIVWLKSKQAFYQIMDVDEKYRDLWAPLRDLVNIAGHTVNVLLRSNTELLTPYAIKKIASIAKMTLAETIEVLTVGRAFVIEQIKNQGKPKLLKCHFFKDLSMPRIWSKTTSSIADKPRSPVTRAEEKAAKVEPKKRSPDWDSEDSPSTSCKPKLNPSKIIFSPDSPSTSKRKADPVASSRKNLASTKPAKKQPSPHVRNMAKRTDQSQSLIPGNLEEILIPDEGCFEYTCHYCGLVLSKSRHMPDLIPRIQLHYQLHSQDERRDNGDGFSDRFDKFLEFLRASDRGEEADVLSWPKRALSTQSKPQNTAVEAPKKTEKVDEQNDLPKPSDGTAPMSIRSLPSIPRASPPKTGVASPPVVPKPPPTNPLASPVRAHKVHPTSKVPFRAPFTSLSSVARPAVGKKPVVIDLDAEPVVLDRTVDVSLNACWKCGFRVSGRYCSQCEAVQ